MYWCKIKHNDMERRWLLINLCRSGYLEPWLNLSNIKIYIDKYIRSQYITLFCSVWCIPSMRHIMMTSSKEIFSALLAIYAGNSPVTGEFSAQRLVMRSFGVFFDLHLNKWLSKQSWGWCFETPSCSLWCHCNVFIQWGLGSLLSTEMSSNYNHAFLWDVITHPCPDFNDGSA